MFISLMRRNHRKDRKENGIYFLSLIIAIVAFYVILSLEKQDVMSFLKEMESQAVEQLLGLIGGVYGFSLFLIFFMIYFAEKYQLERRSHEYGMLLMLGMKRGRLFLWLMVQDFYSSALALAAGLPFAVFLSEAISLVTAKLTGLGIVGHRFTFSLEGMILTVLGFLGIKMLANVLLCFQMVKREPYDLMNDAREDKLVMAGGKRASALLFGGVAFLAAAYAIAIFNSNVAWGSLACFAGMLVLGVVGTFALFKGFCGVLSRMTKVRRAKESLHIFTFRQLQDHVFLRSGSLAVSSLLILIAVACMGYGVAVAAANLQGGDGHSMDFTFEAYDEKSGRAIQDLLAEEDTRNLVRGSVGVKVAHLPTRDGQREDTGVRTYKYDTSSMRKAAERLDQEYADYLENMDAYRKSPHMISLSGINALRRMKGEGELSLGNRELLIYIDPEGYGEMQREIFERLIRQHPSIAIGGEAYAVKGVCSEDIVVDRSITIGFGIILPEERFMEYADRENLSTYWNVYLRKSLIEERGLMQAIMRGNEHFAKSGLEYENYLQNMGRQLFYIVAASYLTIYIALVFLVIANTVISLQYLMQEKKNRRRYRTLICLGSTCENLCASARRQIRWYFGLPLGVAGVSGIFGVISMFAGLTPSSLRGHWGILFGVAAASILVICVIECGYVKMVMGMSSRNMEQLMDLGRSE